MSTTSTTTAATPTRTLLVWCADWPVVAGGIGPGQPAVVLHANRVVACSAAAREDGVRRGLRRREAQSRSPDAVVLAADPDRDARAFEPVAAAVEALAPRLEVVRPGVLAVAARGPSRYYGGDDEAAARVRAAALAAIAGRAAGGAGVADGLFAALLAARDAGGDPSAPTPGGSAAGGVVVVQPGAAAAFLAPRPVAALARVLVEDAVVDLVELLRRLGLRTLGEVAALPPADLLGRFGPLGARVSRLARGLDEHPPRPRPVPPELVVAAEVDPPAEQVSQLAFLARALAAELGDRLAGRGLVCTRISIEVETEHGETLARRWRHEGGLGPNELADRVRWQLDGWLQAPRGRPTGGVSLLRLVPEQVGPDVGRQLGLWGGARDGDVRAARGVARLQGLLGPDAVRVPERRGGRGPGEQLAPVPAHAVRLGTPAATADAGRPWPGRLPAPSPTLVHAVPPPALLVDAAGRPVEVTARGLLSAEPATVAVGGRPPVAVAACAGPWPAEERWWDPTAARRRARLQVVLADGTAHLLVVEAGRWTVEATYD
ncbi:MAG: DNA polymerase Y family protein [Acidimicrobiia bacterium]